MKTSDRQDRKKTFLVTATRGEDHVVRVVAVDACERRPVYDKDEVKHVETVNESIGSDVTWGILGGLTAAGGTVLVVDSASVANNDPSQRAFNAVGPTAALGIGIGTLAVGVGLLTIPLVDGIRASRTRDDHRPYKEDGDITAAAEECGVKGSPAGSVEVGSDDVLPKLDLSFDGDSEPWKWRDVGGDGTKAFSLDLAHALPDAVLRAGKRPQRVKLGMGGTEVASYEAAALFALADDRAWAKLSESRKRCEAPDSLDDCDDVARYSTSYPASKHASAAQELKKRAEPTFTSIRDDDAYARTQAASCKTPETEDACDALKAYLAEWPKGRHVVEGKAALAVGGAAVAKMIAKREAEERAAAARQAAEEAREAARQRAEEAREAAERRAEEAREKVAQGNRASMCRRCFLMPASASDSIGSWCDAQVSQRQWESWISWSCNSNCASQRAYSRCLSQ
ncbi:MAG: hypothetical protein FJ095_17970 [Deltaproteobacteria bacterium]|nr:hypothetical protein [Deltaproteobacteria bacterium]